MVEQSDVPPSERKRSEHAEFVLLKKDLLFSQITEAALQELGYTHTAAALATGTHTQMNNSHAIQIKYVSLKDGDGNGAVIYLLFLAPVHTITACVYIFKYMHHIL